MAADVAAPTALPPGATAGEPPASPGEPIGTFIAPGAQAAIRTAIARAGGCEVFFLGRRGESGRIEEVEDCCRGNGHAVPVLRRAARGYDAAIHNHPSGDLTPSDPDLAIAADLGDLGLAFLIVDNAAERVNPVVKLFERPPPPPPADPGELAAILGPEGALAGALADYEPRPGQLEMASAVAAALGSDGIVAIEAGTGTGKSIAYLVPALLRATRAKERVVVSTNTINLQEQLVRKDIPALRAAWPAIAGSAGAEPPRVALLKGQSNYVCLRKVEDFETGTLAEGLLEDEAEAAAIRELGAWARRTREGTREELPAPPLPSAWEKVQVDGDTCTRTACRHYQECFYFRARREAAAADLVVANHHLLLADLSVRRGAGFRGAAVLPPFRHLVLDEAHHLEEVASEHLGAHVTSLGLRRLLGRLKAARRPDRGALPALLRAARDPAVARHVEEVAIPARAAAEERVETVFALAAGLVTALGRGEPAGEAERGGAEAALRILPAHREDERWQTFSREAVELVRALELLATEVRRAAKRAAGAGGGGAGPIDDPLLLELEALATRVGAAAAALAAFVDRDADGPEAVRWIERRRTRRDAPAIALRSAPLSVAETLAQEVYPNLGGIVLTSATLALGRRFDYFAKRIGLDQVDPRRVETRAIPSPFDYERQALLAIPKDLPEPGEGGYEDACAEALLALAQASGGRAFFLFTSYGALERAHARLAGPVRALGFTPLKQGETTRRRLVERFRQEAPAVLFATDSFWEGVDVRGGALRLVAIARLPFRVPSEPIQEARAEAIAARGGDPFRELAVPQAVLKLKQGFGRLIRAHTDRGAIAILDRRVLTRTYGRLFLDSLPPARQLRLPLRALLPHVAEACA